VTITINLRQTYQVAYVILKSAIAPRPGNWILEKSLDNVTWHAWQYFAITDADCMKHYNMPAVVAGRK
jgi:laminin alpha 1/2